MSTPRRSAKKGTKKAYHHGDLRRALLDAALLLVAETGPEGFTLREVARRADVSATAVYRHFADKRALLIAVALEGQREYMKRVDAAATDDAVISFREQGVAAVRFAYEHPEHFRIMNLPSLYEEPLTDEARAAIAEQKAIFDGALEASRASGQITEGAGTVAIAAYALVYGLARMIVEQKLEVKSADEAEDLARAACNLLGVGMLNTA